MRAGTGLVFFQHCISEYLTQWAVHHYLLNCEVHENTASALTELLSRGGIGQEIRKFNTEVCDEVIRCWQDTEQHRTRSSEGGALQEEVVSRVLSGDLKCT